MAKRMTTYLICGGRDFGNISDRSLEYGSAEYYERWKQYKFVQTKLNEIFDVHLIKISSGFNGTVYAYSGFKIINGGATGPDQISTQWAIHNNVEYKEYKAYWNKYHAKGHKNPAGIIRNIAMADTKPDRTIAFPGGSGTAHMVSVSNERGIPVTIITY